MISMPMAEIRTYNCHQNDSDLIKSITQWQELVLGSGFNLKRLYVLSMLMAKIYMYTYHQHGPDLIKSITEWQELVLGSGFNLMC